MCNVVYNVFYIVGSPGDRKISFAVLGHAEKGDRSDSIHSSTTSISMMDAATGETKGSQYNWTQMEKIQCTALVYLFSFTVQSFQ